MLVSEPSFLCNRQKTYIEIKETDEDDKYIPRLKTVDISQGDHMVIVPSPCGYRRITVQCPCNFTNTARASCRDLACSLRLFQESTIIFGPSDYLKSCVVLTISLWCPYGDCGMLPAMFLQARGMGFFIICHSAELNKIVEATMPMNPYDDRKVSLQRLH